MSAKTIVMICMSVGMTIGALVPWLLGDHDPLGGWSIVGGFIGGIVGIIVGARIIKQVR